MKASRNSGFTLIELVVVITILGILAAFAVPRFIALDTQARVATINAMQGSVKSAAALARGLAMASNVAASGSVTMEGNAITLVNYYPDGSTIAGAVNSNNTAGTGDFTFTAASPVSTGTATWALQKAPTPANCSVSYTPAASGAAPTISVTTTGC